MANRFDYLTTKREPEPSQYQQNQPSENSGNMFDYLTPKPVTVRQLAQQNISPPKFDFISAHTPSQAPRPQSNPIVGENLFLTNTFPIRQNDSPFFKGLKGIGNFATSAFSAPGEALRQGAIQGGNLLTGHGLQDLPKNTSFIHDILPKGASNALGNFQQSHPVIGGLANMALETAADPTSYITGNAIKNLINPQAELGMAGLTPYKMPKPEVTPQGQQAWNDVQNAYRTPINLRDVQSQQLNNTFADTTNNLGRTGPTLPRQGMDPAELLQQKELDAQGVFGGPLNRFKIKPDQRTQGSPIPQIKEPIKISKEDYLTQNGASQFNGDVALNRKSSNMSPATWNRIVDNSAKSNQKGYDLYDKISREYDTKILSGEIVKPSVNEEAIKIAQGHPDNPEVMAARRVLEIQGIEWKPVTATPGLTNEVINVPYGRTTVEVFKNPTDDQLWHLQDRFKKEYPNSPAGEPKTRQTFDPEGNKYMWMSGDSTHYSIEAYLAKKGIVSNQNKFFDLSEHVVTPIREPITKANIKLKPRELNPQTLVESPLTQRTLPEQPKPLTWTNRDNIPSAGQLPIRSITNENVGQLPGQELPFGPRAGVASVGERKVTPTQVPLRVPAAGPIGESRVTPAIMPNAVVDAPIGKVVGAEPIIPAGLKERGVSANIRTDANRPDALRDSFSTDPLVYKQLGNKETLAKAQDIFDQGFDTARTQVDELLAKGQPEAAPLTKMLADKLTNAGDIVGARDLLSNAATKATEAGQFGQAFRILRDADPATFLMTFDKQLTKLNKEGLEQYGKKWKTVDLTPDELTMIGKIEKGNQSSYDSAFEQIQARIADEMPATAWEKITAWRHIAMLLNTTTNIRNVGGNLIMMAMRKAAQRTEGVLQKAVSKADRTQSVFVKKEYRQLADDYVEANKKDLLSGANKYQDNISLSMPDKRVFAKSRIGEKLGMNIDVLEKTRKFNYALLQKGDDPFFKNAYADRLASYAQAKGVKDFSKLGQEAFDIAKKEALESTYKNANFMADFLNKVKRPGKDAGLFRKGIAVATEVAIPFVKTPLNLMATGAAFTPLSLITGFGRMVSKKSAMAGINDMAKGMVGTGIVGLGYTLAGGGILTGGSSKDKDLREYNNATGNAPFSVMGKYSFDWALPISIPLIIGVELYNSTHKSEEEKNKMDGIISGNDDAKLSEKIMNVLGGVSDGIKASGEAVANMSMLQTVKSLLFNPQGYFEGFKDLPKDFVTQLIPSMVGKFASSVDPLVRTQYVKGDWGASVKNSVIAKIPFASKSLQPKLTPFGGETKRIENPIGRTLAQFLSPGIIAKNQGINPKIDTELRRLNEFGLTNQFPTMVPNYIDKTQTHPRIKLTPDETTQYQKSVGQLTLSSFDAIMDSNPYLHAIDDAKKASLLAKAISDAKARTKEEILKSRGLK